ncbi:bacterioferritin [Aestuariispira insulae]|uniref:Bacterioferritin n=1 Tax=Aestuariispira insulae TaxID=1461337 RepID=A0A3D9HIB6_9PROT|nr:bacterioferritin [Aestuariispira insulae]RED49237.1 bacterioferritin [Aestuariispira insulae]
MKGSKKVITALNKVLANELISINQTFLHSRMANDWGFDDFGEKEYKKSIKDMKQADDLIERILFLEGLPNLQDLGKLRIGEDIEEILKCEMQLNTPTLKTLREAIALCETEEDYVSRDLLEEIIEDEEEWLDWLETQQGLVKLTGIKNYLQSQA